MSRPGLPTRGPHVFVADEAVGDTTVSVHGDEAHHLATVLRVRPGDPISVANGAGDVWQAHVADADREAVLLALEESWRLTPPTPLVRVVHALPKGRKLDEVVQRLTELGVDRISPVHSARSEVRLAGQRADKALRRWRAVAVAAARQSRRAHLPVIDPVAAWSERFAGPPAVGAVLWEQATARLSAALGRAVDHTGGVVLGALDRAVDDTGEVVLGVGPEGGLTPEEVAASGLPAATLGATILRTETAALAAVSVLLHRLGRLG